MSVSVLSLKVLAFAACRRQAQVKAAMQHAWSNYVTYAFGHDELMPRSLRGKDPFGGLGATILDSLDTLWLMDMKEEYQMARDWVAHKLNFTRSVLLNLVFVVHHSLVISWLMGRKPEYQTARGRSAHTLEFTRLVLLHLAFIKHRYLKTLWLSDMKAEFQQARDSVAVGQCHQMSLAAPCLCTA